MNTQYHNYSARLTSEGTRADPIVVKGQSSVSRMSTVCADDEMQDEMVAEAGKYPEFAALKWNQTKSSNYLLSTPYGELQLRPCSRYWTVRRNGQPLGHNRGAKVFTDLAAAKAAGFLDLLADFGFVEAPPFALNWRGAQPTAIYPPPRDLADFPEVTLPDSHEWGFAELERQVWQSGNCGEAADDFVRSVINAKSKRWQLTPPWVRKAQGWYELKTRFGILTVRRLIGWIVERDEVPLVWMGPDQSLAIFDKLDEAMKAALIHARDRFPVFREGLQWRERHPSSQRKH
jgi:hypothetical protein